MLSCLTPNSSELSGPEQNDPELGRIREDSTVFSTHQDVVALRRKPHAINPIQKPILPDGHLTHKPENLNDGTSTSKEPGIGWRNPTEGC